MNAGPNRKDAERRALANARAADAPRYVHNYGGQFWINQEPAGKASWAGSQHFVVWPCGLVEDYDPAAGPPTFEKTAGRNPEEETDADRQ